MRWELCTMDLDGNAKIKMRSLIFSGKKNEVFQVPGFAYYFDGTNAIINERTMMIRRSKWLILHFEFHRTM